MACFWCGRLTDNENSVCSICAQERSASTSLENASTSDKSSNKSTSDASINPVQPIKMPAANAPSYVDFPINKKKSPKLIALYAGSGLLALLIIFAVAYATGLYEYAFSAKTLYAKAELTNLLKAAIRLKGINDNDFITLSGSPFFKNFDVSINCDFTPKTLENGNPANVSIVNDILRAILNKSTLKTQTITVPVKNQKFSNVSYNYDGSTFFDMKIWDTDGVPTLSVDKVSKTYYKFADFNQNKLLNNTNYNKDTVISTLNKSIDQLKMYFGSYFLILSDKEVTLQRDVKRVIGDKTVICKVFDIKYSPDFGRNLVNTIVLQMKNDKELYDLAYQLKFIKLGAKQFSEESYQRSFETPEAKAQIEKIIRKIGSPTMRIYVDTDGNIVVREMTLKNSTFKLLADEKEDTESAGDVNMNVTDYTNRNNADFQVLYADSIKSLTLNITSDTVDTNENNYDKKFKFSLLEKKNNQPEKETPPDNKKSLLAGEYIMKVQKDPKAKKQTIDGRLNFALNKADCSWQFNIDTKSTLEVTDAKNVPSIEANALFVVSKSTDAAATSKELNHFTDKLATWLSKSQEFQKMQADAMSAMYDSMMRGGSISGFSDIISMINPAKIKSFLK